MTQSTRRCFGAFTTLSILFVSMSACISNREKAELFLKDSVAESSETVSLDPIFIARQKKAEREFFGFAKSNKGLATDYGQHYVGDEQDVGSEDDITMDASPQMMAQQKQKLDVGGRFAGLSLLWPLRGGLSSPFGMRYGRLHAGIDIRGSRGTPIRASAAGQVLVSGYRGAYGNVVVIGHDHDHQTLYGHMMKPGVRSGKYVKAGDIIGYVGRTGRATGFHLHFETRVAGGIPRDPLRFLPGGRDALVSLTNQIAESALTHL